jgi:hypothetical protein
MKAWSKSLSCVSPNNAQILPYFLTVLDCGILFAIGILCDWNLPPWFSFDQFVMKWSF